MTTLQSQGTLMECTVCATRETIVLRELDRHASRATEALTRHCKYCLRDTLWQIVSHTRGVDSGLTHGAPGHEAIPGEAKSQGGERRKQRRCKMKMTGCIRDGDFEDVVTVLDASRTGIRFQSSRQYPKIWVQVAVPYTRGISNIFMSGRIVWRKSITPTLQEYGLRYDL